MQHTINVNGKQLTMFAVNLNGPESAINILDEIVNPIWHELAPFIREPHQVLYLRDLPAATIDSQYPAGHTYVPTETQIAVPAWPANQQYLRATIAHELHHMARWQNAGYGKTLGQAIITEGLATVYEEHKSGWTPPYAKGNTLSDALKQAQAEWGSEAYDHSHWFYNGPHGRWTGYAIGYRLVREVIFASTHFNLADSLTQQFDNQKLITKLEEIV